MTSDSSVMAWFGSSMTEVSQSSRTAWANSYKNIFIFVLLLDQQETINDKEKPSYMGIS